MRAFFALIIIALFFSCGNEITTLKPGKWRVNLEVQDGKTLPFMMEYKADKTFVISNAEERIQITDIQIEGDSITIQAPVFEGVLKGVFVSEEKIEGSFIKTSLNRIVPFSMFFGKENRFESDAEATVNVTGNWETVFSPNSDEDRYISKGTFTQNGNNVTGTFRTTTGDYRYLEGIVENNIMKLSTFDGAHAFLFEATVTDSTLTGVFYSGNHWKEPFVAKRNEAYELPDADSLTYLKEGYDRFDFSFPDKDGNIISMQDDRFKNKVVLVQIMGTWCPNCLDETKFYSQYLRENNHDDLEIIALAFEYAPTKEKAFSAINRLKETIGVPYPILLAQVGTSNKKKANEKLPMLNHILSYPTTIYIDKAGEVRKIHTGFNGPATGKKFTEFKAEFEGFVSQLLKE